MKPRLVFQIVLFGLLLLIFVSTVTAFAANLNIPDTNIGVESLDVTAEQLKPSDCNDLALTNIVRGSTGTASNDLIIASSADDLIDGKGGDDCILGGGGNDTIEGGADTDICIGGNGNDTFTNCETEIQ